MRKNFSAQIETARNPETPRRPMAFVRLPRLADSAAKTAYLKAEGHA